MLSEGAGLCDLASQEIRLAQIVGPHRLATPAHRGGLFEQRQRLSDTPRQGIGMTQIRDGGIEPGPDIPASAERQVPFEYRDGLGEPPLTEIHPTDRAIRVDQAE